MLTEPAPRLSLCMIVRDEIDGLEAAIDSVSGLVDEVAIVDTGSSDGTWALVQTLAHRCQQIAWPDHFAQARNAALDLVTGDFVLILDGDEQLTGGHAEIRAALATKGLLAAEIEIENKLADGQIGKFWACRLFMRHPQLRWTGRIHEQVLPAVNAFMDQNPEYRLARIPATITHTGYLPENFDRKGKAERNVRLLEQAVAELDPDGSVAERVYLEYKLAMALGPGPVGRNLLLRAASRLISASTAEAGRCGVGAELLVAASQAWRQGGASEQALVAAELAQVLAPSHPMPLLVRGQAQLQAGLVDQASDSVAELKGLGREGFHFDEFEFDAAFTVLEAGISERRGENQAALTRLKGLVERQPQSPQAAHLYLAAVARIGDPKRAIELGTEHMRDHGPTPHVLLACALAADRLGMTERAIKWRKLAGA
jgi:hypothetical protein